MGGPRVVLIDNHDSYTWNLAQLCWEIAGREPTVVRNDETTADAVLAGGFTHVVVSPGPGSPHVPADVGLVPELLRRVDVPTLGVCLGHQAIAAAYGSRVRPAATVMHGRHSLVRHSGTGLFAGLPPEFPAVRYHSLLVPRPAPAPLVETAWADDGVLMGLSHRDRPLHGVQFHPESVGTAAGAALLSTFLGGRRSVVLDLAPRPAPRRTLAVRWRRVRSVPADQAFSSLYGSAPEAFWLDSARRAHGMGGASYFGATGGAPVARDLATLRHPPASPRTGATGTASAGPGGAGPGGTEPGGTGPVEPVAVNRRGYPLPFAGGWVGHLSYAPSATAAETEFRWVDRFVAVESGTGRAYAVTLGLDPADADRWLAGTAAALDALPDTWTPPEPGPVTDARTSVDRDTYGAHLAEIDRWLRAGESYEACYTYRITARSTADPLAAYLRLRAVNPAPYGAYLRSGDRHVLSSSPERFLTVDAAGWAETKPIKGTAARDPERDAEVRAALARDEKNRGENLMIVDLLRNDLGRVCRPGTVQVPELMAVESYATVHHLVSTVRGRLRADVDTVDALAALFPGGSMTGAPKERTVALLAGLETTPRGIYSGCLGWVGPDGPADLSIVIRTAVWEGDRVTVGVGGAITALSDPAEEWAETEVKALAVLRALGLAPAPLPG